MLVGLLPLQHSSCEHSGASGQLWPLGVGPTREHACTFLQELLQGSRCLA